MIERKDQKKENTWDLSALATNSAEWEKEMKELESKVDTLEEYKDKMALSSDNFHNALVTLFAYEEKAEKVLSWAFLNYSVDSANPEVMQWAGLANMLEAKINEKTSWMRPVLMSMKQEDIESYLKEDRNKDYRIFIQKQLRMKEHVLSEKEERLLSLYSANSSGYQQAFMDANNIDLDFGYIGDEKLTHSTFAKFIRSKDEKIREQAYKQLYKEYEKHQHVLGRIFEGSIKNDIFEAKARGFNSALEAALFPDNVPKTVFSTVTML